MSCLQQIASGRVPPLSWILHLFSLNLQWFSQAAIQLYRPCSLLFKFTIGNWPITLRPRELSTRTPLSIQKVLGTCPQHKIIKFEIRQIPSSKIGRNLHDFRTLTKNTDICELTMKSWKNCSLSKNWDYWEIANNMAKNVQFSKSK